MTLLSILVVVAVLCALFGLFGSPRVGWGAGWGWSPLGLILVVLAALWLAGYIRP